MWKELQTNSPDLVTGSRNWLFSNPIPQVKAFHFPWSTMGLYPPAFVGPSKDEEYKPFLLVWEGTSLIHPSWKTASLPSHISCCEVGGGSAGRMGRRTGLRSLVKSGHLCPSSCFR